MFSPDLIIISDGSVRADRDRLLSSASSYVVLNMMTMTEDFYRLKLRSKNSYYTELFGVYHSVNMLYDRYSNFSELKMLFVSDNDSVVTLLNSISMNGSHKKKKDAGIRYIETCVRKMLCGISFKAIHIHGHQYSNRKKKYKELKRMSKLYGIDMETSNAILQIHDMVDKSFRNM